MFLEADNKRMRRMRQIVQLALVLAMCGVGSARAAVQPMYCMLTQQSAVRLHPDSDAPPGAPASWLPSSQWVMERWLPFDERRLYAVLDSNEKQVNTYLYRDETLDDLARDNGVPLSGLATRILGPRPRGAPVARWQVLLQRTRTVLTQSHLAAHLLFHLFHMSSIVDYQVLGVSQRTFVRLYLSHDYSFGQIAAVGGRSEAQVRRLVLRLDAAAGALGVRRGELSASENRILRARDRDGFMRWWDWRDVAMN